MAPVKPEDLARKLSECKATHCAKESKGAQIKRGLYIEKVKTAAKQFVQGKMTYEVYKSKVAEIIQKIGQDKKVVDMSKCILMNCQDDFITLISLVLKEEQKLCKSNPNQCIRFNVIKRALKTRPITLESYINILKITVKNIIKKARISFTQSNTKL